jgi:hypothetical protein
MSSRRRGSIGMARLSLAAPRPRQAGRGHKHPPWQEIGSCETGLSWGRLLIATSSVSRPSAGCFRPALVAGLGISGFWVRQAPRSVAADRHRGSLRPCQTRNNHPINHLNDALTTYPLVDEQLFRPSPSRPRVRPAPGATSDQSASGTGAADIGSGLGLQGLSAGLICNPLAGLGQAHCREATCLSGSHVLNHRSVFW